MLLLYIISVSFLRQIAPYHYLWFIISTPVFRHLMSGISTKPKSYQYICCMNNFSSSFLRSNCVEGWDENVHGLIIRYLQHPSEWRFGAVVHSYWNWYEDLSSNAEFIECLCNRICLRCFKAPIVLFCFHRIIFRLRFSLFRSLAY